MRDTQRSNHWQLTSHSSSNAGMMERSMYRMPRVSPGRLRFARLSNDAKLL